MKPPTIDLRLLRQFVAVAEELHFRRAAQRLAMSQPPLTTAIRRLEEEIGAVLIERGRKTVALTHAGALLLNEAKRLLADAEAIVAAARDAASGWRGLVRVAYVGSAMYGRLPNAIRDFRRAAPDVRLVLRELTTTASVAELREGSVDLAVILPPLAEAGGLMLAPFDADRLALALPADHPMATSATLPDLASEPFVLWPAREGLGFHAHALRLCAEAGFQPHVVQEAHNMHAVLSLVAAGVGVSLVPAAMARLHPETVVFRPLPIADAGYDLMLAYPAGKLSPAATNFVASTAR